MESIVLQEPHVVAEVTAVAAQEGQTAADFVLDAVRRHLAAYRQRQIQAETAAWYRLPAAVRRQYAGLYAAVYHGQIVAQHPDRIALLQQVRLQFGSEPVLIIAGGEEPIPTYRVTSVYSDGDYTMT